MSTTNLVPEEVWEKVDSAINSNNSAEFDKVISEIKANKNLFDNSNYVLGYLYYFYPCNDERTRIVYKSKSRNRLRSIIEKDVDAITTASSKMLLAHHYYDQKEYRRAYQLFKEVNTDVFTSKEMKLKTFEYRLCSFIKIHGFLNSRDKIDEYIKLIKNHDLSDISPDGLLIVFSNLNEVIENKEFKYFVSFAYDIDNLFGIDWFADVLISKRGRPL